jgi:hypothetical protein
MPSKDRVRISQKTGGRETEGEVPVMAKVRKNRGTDKAPIANSRQLPGNAVVQAPLPAQPSKSDLLRWFASLSNDERAALQAKWDRDTALRTKLAPYELLEAEECARRGLASQLWRAEREAKRISKALLHLQGTLHRIDEAYSALPLTRHFQWLRDDGESFYAAALAKMKGQEPKPTPPFARKLAESKNGFWSDLFAYDPTKPGADAQIGRARVFEALARFMTKSAGKLKGEVKALRMDSRFSGGGRPIKLAFVEASRLLEREGESIEGIAARLIAWKIADGPTEKVQERVRVCLNRYADPEKEVHPLGKVLSKVERERQERRARDPFWQRRLGGPKVPEK